MSSHRDLHITQSYGSVPYLFAPNLFMFSFCFPNKWPSCVRSDISFYTNSSIKPPCSLGPALLAFPHNSDLSNPVIWHFSWPPCPVIKVRSRSSTYLKVEVGNLPDSLNLDLLVSCRRKCEPTLHAGWLWSHWTLEPKEEGGCISKLTGTELGFT